MAGGLGLETSTKQSNAAIVNVERANEVIADERFSTFHTFTNVGTICLVKDNKSS